MDATWISETFTAAESQAMAGMSTTNQRNARRHGYLPGSDGGWARNDVMALAKMAIMQHAGMLDIPPALASEAADQSGRAITSAASAVATFAAQLPGAFSDARGLMHPDDRPIAMPPGGLAANFLVIWSDGKQRQFRFVRDAEPILNGEKGPAAAIVLNLRKIAEIIVKSAPRPLWTTGEVA